MLCPGASFDNIRDGLPVNDGFMFLYHVYSLRVQYIGCLESRAEKGKSSSFGIQGREKGTEQLRDRQLLATISQVATFCN